jgi:hypothetical protein
LGPCIGPGHPEKVSQIEVTERDFDMRSEWGGGVGLGSIAGNPSVEIGTILVEDSVLQIVTYIGAGIGSGRAQNRSSGEIGRIIVRRCRWELHSEMSVSS